MAQAKLGDVVNVDNTSKLDDGSAKTKEMRSASYFLDMLG